MRCIPLLIAILVFGSGVSVSHARGYTTGALAAIGDTLWIGTDDGVVRLNMADGSNVRYRTADGLASSWVSAIAVEPSGALWFATNGGVTRYDGHSWKTYTTADGLIYHSVLSAAVDRDGSVWFGTEAGVSRFDGKAWTGYTEADGLALNRVQTIAIGPDGAKWFGTENMVTRFDGKTWTRFKLFEFTDDSPSIRVMRCDGAGTVWVGFTGVFGGFVMGYDGVSWRTYEDMGVHLSTTISLDVDAENVKWFYSCLRLIRYDGTSWAAFQADNRLLPLDCTGIAADRRGRIWLVYGPGVVCFDHGSWTPFPFDLTTGMLETAWAAHPAPILLPNSPNPFNPSTLLRFTLPSAGFASLEIRDSSGRLVRTLASGGFSAGPHALTWDGRDDSGRPSASGVYLSILRAGGKTAAGRMLLLK